MIRKFDSLRSVIVLALIAVVALPAYTCLFLYPSFIGILSENAKEDALRVASHLSGEHTAEHPLLMKDSISPHFLHEMENIQKDLKLAKLKVFSSSGMILFSTDPKEIGEINTKPYFRDIIDKGRTLATIVKKSSKTLEDKVMDMHVVETYVPFTKNGKTVGALEIYYDITKNKERMDGLIWQSAALSLLVSLALILFLARSSFKASRTMRDLKRAEEELRALSLTDELTGLYNRRGLYVLGDHQLKLAVRRKKGIYMLYADLDNLKEINDSYGHQEGDNALIVIASILKAAYRESDVIARIGGDEFVAVPLGISGEEIDKMICRLKERISEHNTDPKRKYDLSLSIGTAYFDPENPSTIEELLAEGDIAMYKEKKRKKGEA